MAALLRLLQTRGVTRLLADPVVSARVALATGETVATLPANGTLNSHGFAPPAPLFARLRLRATDAVLVMAEDADDLRVRLASAGISVAAEPMGPYVLFQQVGPRIPATRCWRLDWRVTAETPEPDGRSARYVVEGVLPGFRGASPLIRSSTLGFAPPRRSRGSRCPTTARPGGRSTPLAARRVGVGGADPLRIRERDIRAGSRRRVRARGAGRGPAPVPGGGRDRVSLRPRSLTGPSRAGRPGEEVRRRATARGGRQCGRGGGATRSARSRVARSPSPARKHASSKVWPWRASRWARLPPSSTSRGLERLDPMWPPGAPLARTPGGPSTSGMSTAPTAPWASRGTRWRSHARAALSAVAQSPAPAKAMPRCAAWNSRPCRSSRSRAMVASGAPAPAADRQPDEVLPPEQRDRVREGRPQSPEQAPARRPPATCGRRAMESPREQVHQRQVPDEVVPEPVEMLAGMDRGWEASHALLERGQLVEAVGERVDRPRVPRIPCHRGLRRLHRLPADGPACSRPNA